MQKLIAWKPFLYDFNVASARVRSYLPCRYLQEEGWNCEIFSNKKQNQYQLVVFQKAYTQKDLVLAKKLKQQGTKIVIDLCDNHFYNPYNFPDYQEREARILQMIELADAVTVATSELKKLITAQEAVVIDDIIYWFPPSLWNQVKSKLGLIREKNDYFRVVWFGSSQLAKIFAKEGIDEAPSGLTIISKVLPALENIHRDIPVQLSVISNSRQHFERETKKVSFPVQYHEWDLHKFSLIFKQQHVCIIPFDFNPFTICKTNNRLATSLNLFVPVVADMIPSYEEFSDFVFFADWENSLRTYATNENLRQQHIQSGHQYIKNKYNKQRAVEQWSALFKQILS